MMLTIKIIIINNQKCMQVFAIIKYKIIVFFNNKIILKIYDFFIYIIVVIN